MSIFIRTLLITGTVLCVCSCLWGQTNISPEKENDFQVEPERFLHHLKISDGEMPRTFFAPPNNWLTSQNALALFSHVYDPHCSSSAINSVTSSILATRTSVGHEARRLIMGYCDGHHYPQVVNTVPIDVAELRQQFRERLETEHGGPTLWATMAPKIDRAIAASKARRAGELLIVFSKGNWGRSAMYEDEMLVAYSRQQEILLNGTSINHKQLVAKLQDLSIACLILNVETPQKVSLEDVQKLVRGITSQIDPSQKRVTIELDL